LKSYTIESTDISKPQMSEIPALKGLNPSEH